MGPLQCLSTSLKPEASFPPGAATVTWTAGEEGQLLHTPVHHPGRHQLTATATGSLGGVHRGNRQP